MARSFLGHRASALHCFWLLPTFAGITALGSCAGVDTVTDPPGPAGVFNGPLPYPPRAYHASDVQYVFSSPDNQEGLSPDQLQLAERMIEYYTSFAESGAPQGQAAWQPYTQSGDAVQSLAPNAIGPSTTFANDHHCAFWARLRGI